MDTTIRMGEIAYFNPLIREINLMISYYYQIKIAKQAARLPIGVQHAMDSVYVVQFAFGRKIVPIVSH
jgi:hypothetical protein